MPKKELEAAMNAARDDILMRYQNGSNFLARYDELRKLRKTEKEIASEMGLSTIDLLMHIRVAKHEVRSLKADHAKSMVENGKTLAEISEALGFECVSSVRGLLNVATQN